MPRSSWRELARFAVLALIALGPGVQALPGLRLLAQRAHAGCGCSGRVCCCATRPAPAGRRASCHEALRTPPAGSPRLRCEHSSDEQSSPNQPATLAAAPAVAALERFGSLLGLQPELQEGHLRLASPPPWLPALS